MYTCALALETQQPFSLLRLKLILYHSWCLVPPALSSPFLCLLCKEQPHGNSLCTYLVPLLRQLLCSLLFFLKIFSDGSYPLSQRKGKPASRREKEKPHTCRWLLEWVFRWLYLFIIQTLTFWSSNSLQSKLAYDFFSLCLEFILEIKIYCICRPFLAFLWKKWRQ